LYSGYSLASLQCPRISGNIFSYWSRALYGKFPQIPKGEPRKMLGQFPVHDVPSHCKDAGYVQLGEGDYKGDFTLFNPYLAIKYHERLDIIQPAPQPPAPRET
jgi:hypothetical protein